jgi:hypothetical protein
MRVKFYDSTTFLKEIAISAVSEAVLHNLIKDRKIDEIPSGYTRYEIISEDSRGGEDCQREDGSFGFSEAETFQF